MVIKYEFYPLGFAHEICRQQDRLSLYQCRLASLLSQGMEDSKLEEYIRHKIDDAAVHIHVLTIMATWEGCGDDDSPQASSCAVLALR